MTPTKKSDMRDWIIQGFNRAEDAVYIGLGLLLAATALTLLITEMIYFGHYLITGALSENIVFLLDRILLIIIFVEVLYTRSCIPCKYPFANTSCSQNPSWLSA